MVIPFFGYSTMERAVLPGEVRTDGDEMAYLVMALIVQWCLYDGVMIMIVTEWARH